MKGFTKGLIIGVVTGVGATVAASVYYTFEKVSQLDFSEEDKEKINEVAANARKQIEEAKVAINKYIPKPGDIVEIKIKDNTSKIRKPRRGFIK